jgi:hypothetical protein
LKKKGDAKRPRILKEKNFENKPSFKKNFDKTSKPFVKKNDNNTSGLKKPEAKLTIAEKKELRVKRKKQKLGDNYETNVNMKKVWETLRR